MTPRFPVSHVFALELLLRNQPTVIVYATSAVELWMDTTKEALMRRLSPMSALTLLRDEEKEARIG